MLRAGSASWVCTFRDQRPDDESLAVQMKVLTFTTLYPSVARPRHGIFVENRLLQLLKSSDVQARVIAPVPWFPFGHRLFGGYADFAQTPLHETRSGISVSHPRYATMPGAGMYLQPFTMARAGAREFVALRSTGFDCDVVDAHYFYPDGVAAAFVARRFAKPLVITARGSDVNLLANLAYPRRLIVWAAKQARAIITVSGALKSKLVGLGIDAKRIVVLRNGVDLELFRPMPQRDAREALGIGDEPLLVSVGNLVPEKGHSVAIDALVELPGMRLAIVGDGPERDSLGRRATRRGVAHRVSFLSVRPQADLRWVYCAADVLVLASSREGWPNVLLEAMACGTPVVAADVGGVPEIVTDPVAGRIVTARSGPAFASAVRGVLNAGLSRELTCQFAQQFDWTATSLGQLTVFSDVLSDRPVTTGVARISAKLKQG
jgi:teichuronic acid biosynthesis glycosyltransferase TuaC